MRVHTPKVQLYAHDADTVCLCCVSMGLAIAPALHVQCLGTCWCQEHASWHVIIGGRCHTAMTVHAGQAPSPHTLPDPWQHSGSTPWALPAVALCCWRHVLAVRRRDITCCTCMHGELRGVSGPGLIITSSLQGVSLSLSEWGVTAALCHAFSNTGTCVCGDIISTYWLPAAAADK